MFKLKSVFKFVFLMLTIPLFASGNGESFEIAGLFDFVSSGNKVTGLNPSQGQSKNFIYVTWKRECDDCKFIIYRSLFKRGPFKIVGTTNYNGFYDESAEPGMKYWYRINVENNGSETKGSEVQYGYRRLGKIKGENFDKVVYGKTRNRPGIRNKFQRKKENEEIKIISKYYTNRFKLSIILFIGKRYIRDGSLLILKKFDNYSLNYNKRILYLTKNKKYRVRFYSKKFFRLLGHIRKYANNDIKLINRLIKNLIVFCIYTGEIEKKLKDGTSIFINYFEAAGLSTEYYKNNADWNSNTIMIGSSNKKIKEMVKKAQ